MNLLDLCVTIGVKDDASAKVASVAKSAKSSMESASQSTGKVSTALSRVGKIGSATGSKFKAVGSAMAKASGAAAVATGAAFVSVGKQALEAYSDYQQLSGGISKLFGTAGQSVEEYAKAQGESVSAVKAEYESLQSAESAVMSNAQNAYKTAGMSANEYMENVSGFAAALTSSLGGDTVKAASQADVAMRAISDNVNTFGTDMESVSYAYQGFAKQNYTMLDNLKLGYGGTKEEMERLIADANEWGAANGQASDLSIDSFSDIVTAIDQIQQKQQIAGTTAREAGTTIEGSINSTKAAWTNLLAELGKDDGDVTARMDELFNSIFGDGTDSNLGVFGNVMPVITKVGESLAIAMTNVAPRIGEALTQYGPQLLQSAAQLFLSIVMGLAQALPAIVSAVAQALPSIIQIVVQNGPQLQAAAVQFFNGMGQALGQVAATLGEALQYVITHLPEIVANGVGAMVQAGGAFLNGLVDGFMGKQTEVDAAAAGMTQSAALSAQANADASGAGQALSDSMMANFDFSGVETTAADAANTASLAAAANTDASAVGQKASETAVSGIDTMAMNQPATEMVSNAITAAKTQDATSVGQSFSQSAASGIDTSAMSSKVSAAAQSAAAAASTNVKVGVQVDTSGIRALASSAAGVASQFASAAARASASLRAISATAATVAASVKRSLNIPNKTIKINVTKGSVQLPHIHQYGTYNMKTNSVPTYGISWYAKGGVFDRPTVLAGVGEAGAEAVLPLKDSVLAGIGRGIQENMRQTGDVYNITLQLEAGTDVNQMALLLAEAIQQRNRMSGRRVAAVNTRRV
jgi:hypothetical protein